MAKTKISEYSSTANSNTDIASINIDEGCAPSGINNAIRALMAQLKDFQQGTNSDSFNGPVNGTVGATTAATGKFTTIEGTDTTDASSTTAAAVKTAGGLAVAKKLYVGTGGAVVDGITVGKGAGSVATNTAVGASALAANTTGSINTAVGYQALQTNDTGVNNTAVGLQALRYNTTGGSNSSLGYGALYSNTTGGSNTALGRDALVSNTTASNNTAVGYQAGYTNTTGTGNVFIGDGSGYSNSSSNYNTCVGHNAGNSVVGNAGQGRNTFLGLEAGYFVTSGTKNTIVGSYTGNQGGLDIRTSSNYIVLSDGDGNPRGFFDGSGHFAVGSTTTGYGITSGVSLQNSGIGAIIVGHISGTGGGNGYINFNYNGGAIGAINQNGTTAVSYNTTSDYRLKENVQPLSGALDKVAALKPCTYTWKSAPNEIGEGFIAHELAEVCPQAVTGEKDAVDEDGNAKYQSIDTSFLVATLTAAIQELNAKVDAQAAELAALKGQA